VLVTGTGSASVTNTAGFFTCPLTPAMASSCPGLA
jgi:hypothetical protein